MKNNNYYKIGFYGTIGTVALLIFFSVLKLSAVIAWSWWWVTSPLWIPVTLALIVVILFFILIRYYAKKIK